MQLLTQDWNYVLYNAMVLTSPVVAMYFVALIRNPCKQVGGFCLSSNSQKKRKETKLQPLRLKM